jgi:hypothetical protein
MSNEMKQRFIKLLEQDAAQAQKAAQAWRELEQNRARLEDAQGKIIATATDMVTKYTEREKELRDMIAWINALP